MFENILKQEEIVNSLSKAITSNTLSPSLLFSGNENSGKLTSALELARILSCLEKDAKWNCNCASCVRHRILIHSDLCLLGKRNFSKEILSAYSLLERADSSQREKVFFMRSVQKLKRRFDEWLFEGEESRLAKVGPILTSIDELQAEFEIAFKDSTSINLLGEVEINVDKKTKALECAKKMTQETAKLAISVPETIPVFQIRSLSSWAHLKPVGKKKVIILENAENMQETSRNALLKILEEPPESVQFVLLTDRRAAIMKTIQSRVHTYYFKKRTNEDASVILERIFKEANSQETLESYFSKFTPLKTDLMHDLSSNYISGIINAALDLKKPIPLEILSWQKDFKDNSENPNSDTDTPFQRVLKGFFDAGANVKGAESLFIPFLESLTFTLSSINKKSNSNPYVFSILEKWKNAINKAHNAFNFANIKDATLIEILYYEMRNSL